jgi:hypothetical protein
MHGNGCRRPTLTMQSDGSYAVSHQLPPGAPAGQVHTMAAMTKSKKLDALVNSVEDLLTQLPGDLTPELAELRDKVDAGIFEAWTSIAGEGWDTLNRTSRRSGAQLWTTVGFALLAGATGLCAYQIASRRLP